MSFCCKLCLRDFDTSHQLIEHFDDHFPPQECGNCNQQLILINGEYYYLRLHLVTSCSLMTHIGDGDATKINGHAIPEEYHIADGMENKHAVNGVLASNGKQSPSKCRSSANAPVFLNDLKERKISNGTKDSTCHYKLSCKSDEYVHDADHYKIEYLDEEFESLDQSLERDDVILANTIPVQQIQQIKGEKQVQKVQQDHQYITTYLEISPVDYAPLIPIDSSSNSSATVVPNVQQARQFQCNVCQKYYLSKQTLAVHMKNHNKPSDTKTKHIGKVKVQLSYHVNSHKKAIKCSYSKCEKTFETYGALMAHKRFHTSEKPVLQCLQNGCDRTFDYSVDLKRHLSDEHKISASGRVI